MKHICQWLKILYYHFVPVLVSKSTRRAQIFLTKAVNYAHIALIPDLKSVSMVIQITTKI